MPLENRERVRRLREFRLISPAKDGLGPEGRKKLKNAGVPMRQYLARNNSLSLDAPAKTPGIITKDTRASLSETENAPVLEGTTTVNGLPTLSPEAAAFEGVLREQMGIRGIDVLRAVQVQSPGPLGTELKFPRSPRFRARW